MALTLSIQGQSQFEGLPARNTLVRWTLAALERDAELTVRFVGAAEARKLNREYRARDYATNVLTFDYANAPVVRADIVLCVPVIKREAREQRKPFRQHLAHLMVHGVLHAQGHAHDRAGDARKMESREVRILAKLGIDDPYLAAGD
ncbi:MAG: rRNA maturation RNase YbeY [Burkholderiaceae bacterium]